MPTNYPGALDTLTNPAAGDPRTSPSHAAQHSTANDAIEALETKVGTGSSTPATAGHVLKVTGAGATAYGALASSNLAFVGARAHASAATSLANATFIAIALAVEDYDTSAFHSTASNTGRMTAPVAGYYHLSASVEYNPNTAGERIVRLMLNGLTEIAWARHAPATSGESAFTVSTDYQLAATDYVELQAWQNIGSAMDVLGSGRTSFSIHLIGV